MLRAKILPSEGAMHTGMKLKLETIREKDKKWEFAFKETILKILIGYSNVFTNLSGRNLRPSYLKILSWRKD